MKPTVLGFVAILCCTQAQAITWGFEEDGDARGWQAWVYSAGSVPYPLALEIRDGVLRVPMPDFTGGYPALTLISPEIGAASALFDQVRVRLRLVTRDAKEGGATLRWTNEGNRLTPGCDPDRPSAAPLDYRDPYWFRVNPRPVFTGDWQELLFAGFAADAELAWSGALMDIRLDLTFGAHGSQGPEALEIDWVQLTGMEEQLSGELPPPGADVALARGALFAPAVFVPLDRRGLRSLALGDLDGDGDLDAIVHQAEPAGRDGDLHGLVALLNDGQGCFSWGPRLLDYADLGYDGPAHGGVWPKLRDLDGDGDADLLIGRGASYADLWRNDGPDGFERAALWEQRWVRCVADVDRDGDEDLCFLDMSDRDHSDWCVWGLNDGAGRFPEEVRLDAAADNRLLYVAGDLLEAPGLEVVLTPPLVSLSPVTYALDAGYEVRGLGIAAAMPLVQKLDLSAAIQTVATVGDFNCDGHLDFLISQRRTRASYKDLEAHINRGDGSFAVAPWLPADVRLRSESMPEMGGAPYAWDFSGDGVLDWLFIDCSSSRGRNALVLVGRSGQLALQEGQYALPGGGELAGVDAGDIDGDGDVDLVLSTTRQGGGLMVLRTQLSQLRTHVAEQTMARPEALALGATYPNPFNAATVIPLTLPTDAHVRVTMYNTAGQRVRLLADADLAAGRHSFGWDGVDDHGRPVAAGVYVCEAWTARSRLTRKAVLLP